MITARYVHTNIIALNWRRLASFYEEVFGCKRLLPERDLRGEWLNQLTGLPDAHLKGVHLRLPGYGENGPTLEIFEYASPAAGSPNLINRPGLAHLAFAVEDVEAGLEAVVEAGGGAVGQLVSTEVEGMGTLTVVYVADPEGNIIELQKWSPKPGPS
jgi:predicted enzyme related to lactoylglutathione lyase